MAGKNSDNLMQLKRELKNGELKPLYIFHGEEEFLREMYVKRVRDCVPDGGFPEFNHIKIEGRDVPFEEYDDAWEGFPMMTDKRLVHIKDSGIFAVKSGKGEASSEDKKEFWGEKLKRISDDTVVIFEETSVDKRSALYKAASKVGMVVEFKYLSDSDLVAWVVKQFLNAKKKISKENAYYLITITDKGLANLSNEVKKLIDFCDDEVYKTDIDRVVSKSTEVVVFELTDSIMIGNTQKAMQTLSDLKTIKENPFTIMYLMLGTFEKILQAKLMSNSSLGEIASALGLSPFVSRKYIDGAKGFSEKSLISMIRRVPEIDLEIKEGRVEQWGGLELYVMNCIHLASQKKSK